MQQEKNKKTEKIYTPTFYYSLASFLVFLLNFTPEMKKILVLITNLLICVGFANAAVRDGTAVSRTKSDTDTTQSRTATSVARTTTPRTTALKPRSDATISRTATTVSSRTTGKAKTARTAAPRTTTKTTAKRGGATNISARSATSDTSVISNTQTGVEYERCKNTYFSCMDQFCKLKNDDYRRCSCNDRVFKLTELRKVLQDAGNQLTVFTENLETVGMTAAQATAMRQETEGEKAFTSDNSASKALLNAIMNSIRGEDTTVGGKYADLNSINITFDTVNAFGMTDIGQAIAAYNGNALYNAVYPQCRQAVRADCNDSSLQRAITAYLMAIEQDCNTVQTAIENTQKQLKSAVREGGAMLDLARIENRQKHNSSDITTCMNEVETAILSEEVCGANYHKCLDNGEFIDVSTGAPISGIEDFYKLEKMLTFSDGIEAVDQKLSKNPSNRKFVTNFENRVKKFAEPALDKCVENADFVWSEYLDKAMLSIYYSQRDKVAQIRRGCFDYITACYMNGDTAITAAMAGLSGDSALLLQPDKIQLNATMCQDYVNSCDNMFGDGDGIIKQYIDNHTETDTLTACRAIAKQCFDKYGGQNYENFYYPFSGLFEQGDALRWFALYETQESSNNENPVYVSKCAQQLTTIDACNDKSMIETVFGGMDYYTDKDQYGLTEASYKERAIRQIGVATEVYHQILSQLSTQCTNLQGRFVEYRYINKNNYHEDDFCKSKIATNPIYRVYTTAYSIGSGEDMCPRDYRAQVDTQSWGACLCWENGGRRSKWGKSPKCVAALPATTLDGEPANDDTCNTEKIAKIESESFTREKDTTYWCTQPVITNKNKVCPIGAEQDEDGNECKVDNNILNLVPEGM